MAAPRAKDEAKPDSHVARPRQNLRENFRARMNENVVTIMAGSPSGTDLAIVQDIADVLDDGDRLRVLPMVGKGPEQNIKDVMFLRGVDMGITQANILKHFAKTGELGPNFIDQIAYIAKLFNEEMHILVRSDVNDIHELKANPVNFGAEGSGTEITGRLVFEALGIEAQEVHLSDADAIQKLKSGEIAATIVVTGKPAPALANIKDTSGLKLLAVPYAKELEDSYYPATLTHDDYPELIAARRAGRYRRRFAPCWSRSTGRAIRCATRKIAKFVDRFFSNFDAFLNAAAPSEMARGQFRGDARRLASLAAGARLDRPRPGGVDRHRLAQPFRRLPGAGERPARARRSPTPNAPICSGPSSNGTRAHNQN